MNESVRRQLVAIYDGAVAAVAPGSLMRAALGGNLAGTSEVPRIVASARRIFLLAVGKAAAGMAQAAWERMGRQIVDAVVIAPRGAGASLPAPMRLFEAAHPEPDDSSQRAGLAALELARQAHSGDLLLLALSGGASALMVAAAEGITLEDKLSTTRLLLRASCPIRELNAVRKHISAVKGGGLLRTTSDARVLSLIISDVPGNDIGTIGSGPTAADATTFEDVRLILKRHQVWGRVPEAVRDRLDRGARGLLEETLKPGDPQLAHAVNLVIGDNARALDAAAQAARAAGFTVDRGRDLSGEADELGRRLGLDLAASTGKQLCVLSGGEAVVRVRGHGRGGRAQQCALALGLELAGLRPAHPVAALVAGTDGIDGPTDAAGGFADADLIARARSHGLDAAAFLTRNDAYSLLEATGDLFKPGPTGTNVADIFIGLVNY